MTEITKLEQVRTYSGPRFTVERAAFDRNDGSPPVVREWIVPGDVVAIMPYDGTHVWLARQPREVTGRRVLSLCAGKIEPGETPFAAAGRELSEEFGIRARSWTFIRRFYTSEGITDERTSLWLAEGLEEDPKAVIDEAEGVEIVKVPREALHVTIQGCDNAKALIGLLWLERRLVG